MYLSFVFLKQAPSSDLTLKHVDTLVSYFFVFLLFYYLLKLLICLCNIARPYVFDVGKVVIMGA